MRGEDALPDAQLRALARQTAALYTQNDLADYTVIDTCVFIPACLPNDSRHPEENRYFSVWTYGSEDPQTVAEESFVICLAAATGKFVSIETPESWPFGNTFYQMIHDDTSFTYTYVQLSKTVPYPEMPDLSWLEAWYCEKHGLENNL